MNQIVAFALKQRVLIVVMLASLFIAGIAAFINLNTEAHAHPVLPACTEAVPIIAIRALRSVSMFSGCRTVLQVQPRLLALRIFCKLS